MHIKSKKSGEMEIKNLALEIKEVKEIEDDNGVKTGVVVGYAAAFNNIDFGNDRIMPGAFKKTIREKKGHWPILADHDPRKMIGINSTAKEDDFGLLTEFHINLEVQQGKEKFALAKQAMEMGVPLGLSIGFRTIKCDFEDVKKFGMVRNLHELKMYEHSVVTFPMNDLASVTDAKSMEGEEIKSCITGLVERLKTSGHSHDSIRELINETLDGKKAVDEPSETVHSLNKLIESIKS